jgi:hypothetical protein
MAGNRKRQPKDPAQEAMRKILDQLQKLSNSPLFRDLRESPPTKSNPELMERIRKFSESPSIRRVREQLLAFMAELDEGVPPPAKKRKRAPGAGRPSTLTEEEIERGVKLVFSAIVVSEVALSPKRVCWLLREAGIGVKLSDLTLRRQIINAARDRLRGKLVSEVQ